MHPQFSSSNGGRAGATPGNKRDYLPRSFWTATLIDSPPSPSPSLSPGTDAVTTYSYSFSFQLPPQRSLSSHRLVVIQVGPRSAIPPPRTTHVHLRKHRNRRVIGIQGNEKPLTHLSSLHPLVPLLTADHPQPSHHLGSNLPFTSSPLLRLIFPPIQNANLVLVPQTTTNDYLKPQTRTQLNSTKTNSTRSRRSA